MHACTSCTIVQEYHQSSCGYLKCVYQCTQEGVIQIITVDRLKLWSMTMCYCSPGVVAIGDFKWYVLLLVIAFRIKKLH